MKKVLPILTSRTKKAGFTLIELLVVIGILAVLLAITLVAINPARQFAQANDTQRQSDVNAILNAVHQFMADNNGQRPTGITTAELTIASGAGNADICNDIVSDYLAAMPVDPTVGASTADCTSYNTGYTVLSSADNNRITVAAPGAEIQASISATR